MFEGFRRERVRTAETEIDLVTAGSGPPLLLLHGYPETRAMWHRVAPVLAGRFTVVVPDLRGYGASDKPPAGDDHAGYGKRRMAADQAEVMDRLGHRAFSVAGHDRGGRVAYRLALDHPAQVTRLAVLDIVPTVEQWDATDMARALAAFHWQFLAQPAPLPERLIGQDPDFFLEWLLRSWAAPGFVFDPAALDAYRAAFRDPAVIHATCEDYRAGATLDHALDAEDRRVGRRIACPVLVLWGGRRRGSGRGDPVEVWQRWAADVRGRALECGHFLPEEKPEETARELGAFFGGAVDVVAASG
jgi:haloacetate dehalogenase